MTEIREQPRPNNEGPQSKSGYSQYQHQTLTIHDTLGLVLMSILAFALLVGLLRQQAHYHELATQLTRPK
jgi:hypothetical protein